MSRWPFKKILVGTSIVGLSLFARLSIATDDAATEPQQAAVANIITAKWCLRLPQDGHVAYRGVASFDEAGTGTSSFLYPAPNAAGLLVGVLTHGLLVDSAKKKQKDNLQAAADNVLSPYRVVLDNFNYRDLMRRAVEKTLAGTNAKLIEYADNPGHEMIVEIVPIFSLTQDQKTIVLDNTIVIHMAGNVPIATYQNTARVISTPRDADDLAAFWTANDGEKLKDESAQLVAESIDIAFRCAATGVGQGGEAYRTVRYREGSAEKFERAQVLSNHCGRLLIRTLRGTLMSVPASRAAADSSAIDFCGPDAHM